MTTPPAVFGEFGISLAFAERALTDNLREHLAQRDTKPETWYALHLVAVRGPALPREAMIRDLAGSPNVDAGTVPGLLARLEAEGLIRGDAIIDLTAEGEALHASLREYIAGPTVRLLSQFDIRDIETTVRTMKAITERVTEEASAASR